MFSSQICRRPLKKGSGSGGRLGPPDVYPQEQRQKEDELSAVTLKQGFIYTPVSASDSEYGSGRAQYTTALSNTSNITAFLNAVLTKKEELNVLQDSNKKKTFFNNKDQFYPPSSKTRITTENFFREQLTVPRPVHLPKRVPLYTKKEDLFMDLFHYGQISYVRAAWFIKLTQTAIASQPDTKPRKRQVSDPGMEWTQAMLKVLKDLLSKLVDAYRITQSDRNDGTSSAPSTVTPGGNTSDLTKQDHKLVVDQWKYMLGFAQYLFDESLLDRHEFCSWFVDTMEKARLLADGGLLKLLLPSIMKFLREIFQSEILTRKLATFCSKYISSIVTPNPSKTVKANGVMKSTEQLMDEALDCPHHGVTLQLAMCILQLIVVQCPSACIWNPLIGERSCSALDGSPLDSMPIAPSKLPLSPSVDRENPDFKMRIKWKEEEIQERSRLVESHWANTKIISDNSVPQVWLVLAGLEALDRYSFQKSDNRDNMDALYASVFKSIQSTEISSLSFKKDFEPLILLLCHWAASPQRSGIHRSLVVAHLLERLQTQDLNRMHVLSESTTEGFVHYPLQETLFKFLDLDGPKFEATGQAKNQLSFDSLVLLFSELISRNVFSHDLYLSEIISKNILSREVFVGSISSRNELKRSQVGFSFDSGFNAQPSPSTQSVSTPGSIGNYEYQMTGTGMSYFQQEEYPRRSYPQSPGAYGFDRKTYQFHQNLHQEPYSFEDSNPLSAGPSSVENYDKPASVSSLTSEVVGSNAGPSVSHHYQYVLHFPIPDQDGIENNHDFNQRAVLLFGPGRNRENARQACKKLTKDVLKLFGKKNCFDVSEGRIKAPKVDPPTSYGPFRQRFLQLPIFDRKMVSSAVISAMLDDLTNFWTGMSSYFPTVENIIFAMETMDQSFSVTKLLKTVTQVLGILKEIEQQLQARAPTVDFSNSPIPLPSIILFCVGILRKYHCCLLIEPEFAAVTFDCLRKIVARVGHPSDCCSAERCILAYMYDLYLSCSLLRSRYCDSFQDPSTKIKKAFMGKCNPSTVQHIWNREHEYLVSNILGNPRLRPAPSMMKQLTEPSWQHVFVVNTIERVCKSKDADEVNEIACLCSEITSRCGGLTPEWWAAILALTFAHDRTKSAGYQILLEKVDVSDVYAHERLAIFSCILVARHCMRLEDFIGHVAIRRLMLLNIEPSHGGRLAAHLMVRLLRGCHAPLDESGNRQAVFYLKYSWDRQLLISARRNLGVAPLLAVLKALLVLSDFNRNVDDEDDSDVDLEDPNIPFGVKIKQLDNFARVVLREICQEDTARECLLKELENLFSTELILDPILKPEQKRHLVQLLCYPLDVALTHSQDRVDDHGRHIMQQILRNLDQWNFRVSWVEIMLQLDSSNPTGSLQERNNATELFAKSVIEIFQLKGQEIDKASTPAKKNKSQTSVKYELDPGQHVYYISPLIAKLPMAVQRRVLHHATLVLEISSWSIKSKDREKITRSNLLLCHAPFVSMMLSCLDVAKGGDQDDLRENLLTSVFNQLTELSKEEHNCSAASDLTLRAPVLDALSLRLSLVGSLFEIILKNMKILSEWAVLLAQLITSGCVEPQSPVFTTVMDILMVLMHIAVNASNETAVFSPPGSGSTGSGSGVDKVEEKKLYSILVKRIRKEIGEKRGAGIEHIKTLLPLAKKNYTVIACEQYGMVTDSKGNKTLLPDKKPGLRVSHKVELNPWELLEGFKNSPPLPWSLFNAIKIEKKLLHPDLQARLLTWHNHPPAKAIEYFLEAPPVPAYADEEKPSSQEEPSNESETTSIETSSPRSPRSARPKNRKTSTGNMTPSKKRATKANMGQFLQPPGYNHEPQQPVPPPTGWYANNPMPQGTPRPSQQPRFPYTNQSYVVNQPGGPLSSVEVRTSLLNRIQSRAVHQGNMPVGQPQCHPTLNYILNQPNQHRPPMQTSNQQAMIMTQRQLQQQQHQPQQHSATMQHIQRHNMLRQAQQTSAGVAASVPYSSGGMGYNAPDQSYGHMMQQPQEVQSQSVFIQEFQPQQPSQMQQNNQMMSGMFMQDPQGRQQPPQNYRQQNIPPQQSAPPEYIQQQQSQFSYRHTTGR